MPTRLPKCTFRVVGKRTPQDCPLPVPHIIEGDVSYGKCAYSLLYICAHLMGHVHAPYYAYPIAWTMWFTPYVVYGYARDGDKRIAKPRKGLRAGRKVGIEQILTKYAAFFLFVLVFAVAE